MKIYTAEYDADRPSTKSVEVPLNSKFGVAVGVKYNGEDVKVRPGEILLDGLSASDAIGDRYAVFRLSSDGQAGYDRYTVETATDGMTVKELSFDASISLTSGKGVLSAALPAEWIGAELYCNPVPSAAYDYSKNPFQSVAKKDDGTEKWGSSITYFLNANGNTVAFINNMSQGFTDKYQQFWISNADGTITKTDTWTITPDVKTVYVNVSVAGSYKTASIDYTYTERVSRRFQLYVKKADKGEIEGYGENYVFKNTVNLSGTYADDTDFSYTLPTVN